MLLIQSLLRLDKVVLIQFSFYQKFSDWVYNEVNNNNKHSLRRNTKGYGGKVHQTDSQNSDTTPPSGWELYHLQFSLQAASPETFGYTFVYFIVIYYASGYEHILISVTFCQNGFVLTNLWNDCTENSFEHLSGGEFGASRREGQ
jgi:hypothetical protein